ncbi:hypothetical protein AAFC00_004734 [Neodothiora populina]|uniref:Rhodopsin domain-containing protein n=1 Tax=Neodothiora populina TaxID=2781224 RepID=A0ABR3P365_9PEZI
MALKMAPRQKIALIATVALGGIPIIASIIRCLRVSQILTSTDPTWKSYDSSNWSAVDTNVSVICASAPALKPLLRQIAPRLMGSSFSTSQPGYSGGYGSGGQSWMGTGRSTEHGFELRSASNYGMQPTHSQTELAHTNCKNEWFMTNDIESQIEDDDHSDISRDHGITKSTHVVISSESRTP